MNESTKSMIEKLHARLNDLSEVVDEIPFELNGYDVKLDKIDDQVYLIEVELEKKLEGAKPLEKVSTEDSKAFDDATTEGPAKATKETSVTSEASSASQKESSEDTSTTEGKEKEGFLTDSAKETIAGATKTLNSLYKDGKEVFGEFSEALSDVKEVFGGPKKFFKK